MWVKSCTDSRPFIIDLESTNGTHVNDQEIPKTRYYELRNSDGELMSPRCSQAVLLALFSNLSHRGTGRNHRCPLA